MQEKRRQVARAGSTGAAARTLYGTNMEFISNQVRLTATSRRMHPQARPRPCLRQVSENTRLTAGPTGAERCLCWVHATDTRYGDTGGRHGDGEVVLVGGGGFVGAIMRRKQ